MHQAGADGGEGQDLAGEIDLLDQPGVPDDRRRRGVERGDEEVPGDQAREQVEGEVGDARPQELAEDQPVDRQQEQRAQPATRGTPGTSPCT